MSHQQAPLHKNFDSEFSRQFNINSANEGVLDPELKSLLNMGMPLKKENNPNLAPTYM